MKGFVCRVLYFLSYAKSFSSVVVLLEGRLAGRQWENKQTSLQIATLAPQDLWVQLVFTLMAASDWERPSIVGVQTQVSTKVAEEILFGTDEIMKNKSRGSK